MESSDKIELLESFIKPLMPGLVFSEIEERDKQRDYAVYKQDGGGREISADGKISAFKNQELIFSIGCNDLQLIAKALVHGFVT